MSDFAPDDPFVKTCHCTRCTLTGCGVLPCLAVLEELLAAHRREAEIRLMLKRLAAASPTR